MATDTLNTILLNGIMNPNLKMKKLEDKNLTNMEEKIMPADGNCLFWSAMMSYLEPVKTDSKEFEKKCEKLFGAENKNWEELFNNFDNNTEKYPQVKELMLTFRKNVIEYMEENAPLEKEHKATIGHIIDDFNDKNKLILECKGISQPQNFQQYCETMKVDGIFGDNLELMFISKFLECNIIFFQDGERLTIADINDNEFKEEIVLNFRLVEKHYNYYSYAHSADHKKQLEVTNITANKQLNLLTTPKELAEEATVGVLMNNTFDKWTAETPGSSYDPTVDNPYWVYCGTLRGGTLGLLLRFTACSWSIFQNNNDSNTNRNAIETRVTISEDPTNVTINSNQPRPKWTNTIQQECSNLQNVASIEKITKTSKQLTN